MDWIANLPDWVDLRYWQAGAAGTLVLVVAWLMIKTARAVARMKTPLEDVLTWIVAGVTTGVSAQGMWVFFGEVMHFHWIPRLVCSSFLEFAMLVSALRAKKNAEKDPHGRGGVDERAVWVLSAATGVLSSMHAVLNGRMEEAMVRMVAPFAAAWLWKRGLKIAHKIRTGAARRINHRFSLERILVALRLAEASSRTASDVDTHRRLNKVARAAKRLKVLQETGAKSKHIEKASRYLDKVMDGANAHTGLASNDAVRQQLMDQVSVLFNASYLAQANVLAPWNAQPDVPELISVQLQPPPPMLIPPAVGDEPAPKLPRQKTPKTNSTVDLAAAKRLVAENPNIKAPALAEKLGVSRATGYRILTAIAPAQPS